MILEKYKNQELSDSHQNKVFIKLFLLEKKEENNRILLMTKFQDYFYD